MRCTSSSLLPLVCGVLAIATTSGAPGGKRCVYEIADVQNKECDPVTAIQVVNYTLAEGPADKCELSKEWRQICLGCKYKEAMSKFSPCINGERYRKGLLKEGSSEDCPLERTVTRNCGRNTNKKDDKSDEEEADMPKERCFYNWNVKWSRCIKGFESKNLRLKSKKGVAPCPKYRLIRRLC